MQDPTIFHGCLLLAGMHWYWVHGDVTMIQDTYLYHKLEAIRLVNEQLGDPGTKSSDSVIGTIACLALAEVRSTDHALTQHQCPASPTDAD